MAVDLSRSVAFPHKGWLQAIAASLRANAPIIAVVILYLTFVDSLSAYAGKPNRSYDDIGAGFEFLAVIGSAVFTAVFVVWFLHLTLIRKVSIQTRQCWRLVRT